MLILCMWLQVINKVKVTQYHIKVKVKISTSLQRRGNNSFQSKTFKGINLQGTRTLWGTPAYDFAKVSKELHEIEKFLGLRRGAPLPDRQGITIYFLKIHNLLLMFLIPVKSTRCPISTEGSLRLKGILVSIFLLLYRANLEMVIFYFGY